MNAYRERFLGMFKEIKACSKIDITAIKDEIPKVSQDEINDQFTKIENFLGYKLDEKLKDCLFITDEISLSWGYELEENEYENGGEFRLSNLYHIISSNQAELWYEEMEDQEKEFYKKLVPFDDHPNTGDGVMSVFKMENGEASPEVWLYDSNGMCHKMLLDYPSYLEKTLETKGFYGWQYLFCEVDLSDYYFATARNQLEKMLNILPKLFPNNDYKEYFDRFANVNK
ncbi:SMI1/KNR4 family protein [Nostoc sp. FACHB-152]|uniref:SMI1/KNR4 family protein n=1 Tax=unclassified Nostoc TaxID=2593658 RepID=UPI0016849F73|nr:MULTISPECIES: SMI1/KNR4 family protein [unclassified Nostoc]MBD2449264.1 SMI1/KNR4 family protein [Nostoc sp. FACHB-152]MBD2470458.1 SMI1/KNR4 family protein [Nostoc sp. FACHB-145]